MAADKLEDGITPPKLNMKMSDEDFKKLCEAMEDNKLLDFINNYKDIHKLTSDEVLALGLMKCINNYDEEKAEKLLFLNNEVDTYNFFTPYPLITLNESEENVIQLALKKGSCISALSTYIFMLNDENLIANKFILENELQSKIATVIMEKNYDSSPESIIEKLIEPLYTEKSSEHVKELLGDWLSIYYL